MIFLDLKDVGRNVHLCDVGPFEWVEFTHRDEEGEWMQNGLITAKHLSGCEVELFGQEQRTEGPPKWFPLQDEIPINNIETAVSELDEKFGWADIAASLGSEASKIREAGTERALGALLLLALGGEENTDKTVPGLPHWTREQSDRLRELDLFSLFAIGLVPPGPTPCERLCFDAEYVLSRTIPAVAGSQEMVDYKRELSAAHIAIYNLRKDKREELRWDELDELSEWLGKLSLRLEEIRRDEYKNLAVR